MSRPYATEAERLEARRQSWRDSKARKTAARAERKAKIEAWVEQLINRGTGSPERRALMLEILERRKEAA